jgi:integrase
VEGKAWERTRSPGIFRNEGPRGIRYKVVFLDSDGRQRTKNLHTLKQAQAFQGDIRLKKSKSVRIDPAPGRATVNELWAHFLKTAAIRPSTWALYETHGRLYVLPALGRKQVQSVTVADIKVLLANMRESRRSAATITAVRRLLHRLFAVAVEEDRIARNPVSRVSVERVEPREPRFLTQEEVRRIAAEVPEQYRALVSFLAWTGLRIGEASALLLKNLDLSARTIRVTESSPEVGGRKYIGPTKTSKARTVHFGARLAAILKTHLAAHGTPLDPKSFVFTTAEGGQIRQNNFLKRIFQPAAMRAGIEPVPTVHDLRHTAASLMALAGFSMRDAQEQLGHSHTTMTDRYTHLFPEDRERKVAALDALLPARDDRR